MNLSILEECPCCGEEHSDITLKKSLKGRFTYEAVCTKMNIVFYIRIAPAEYKEAKAKGFRFGL
jgi:hypothetical protein